MKRFESIICEMLGEHIIRLLHQVVPREEFDAIVADVAQRRMDKVDAVEGFLARILESEREEHTD